MKRPLMYVALAGSSFVISACAGTLTPSSQELEFHHDREHYSAWYATRLSVKTVASRRRPIAKWAGPALFRGKTVSAPAVALGLLAIVAAWHGGSEAHLGNLLIEACALTMRELDALWWRSAQSCGK